MTDKQDSVFPVGKRVYWNDPDGGSCSVFATIIGNRGDVIVLQPDGSPDAIIEATRDEIEETEGQYEMATLDYWFDPNVSDAALTAAIAGLLRSKHNIDASSEQTGGWIYCVLIPTENPDLVWFWGTASECWGASLIGTDGENPANLDTTVPSDSRDAVRIADAIATAMPVDDDDIWKPTKGV